MESLNDLFPSELDIDVPPIEPDPKLQLKLEKALKRKARKLKKRNEKKLKSREMRQAVKRVNHFVAIQVTNSQVFHFLYFRLVNNYSNYNYRKSLTKGMLYVICFM